MTWHCLTTLRRVLTTKRYCLPRTTVAPTQRRHRSSDRPVSATTELREITRTHRIEQRRRSNDTNDERTCAPSRRPLRATDRNRAATIRDTCQTIEHTNRQNERRNWILQGTSMSMRDVGFGDDDVGCCGNDSTTRRVETDSYTTTPVVRQQRQQNRDSVRNQRTRGAIFVFL